jgi:hypothetical protein
VEALEQRMRLAGRHGFVIQHVNPKIGKALAPVDSSMWVPRQEELEAALLALGMQRLTLHELRDLAVATFPVSRRRARLMGRIRPILRSPVPTERYAGDLGRRILCHADD